MIFNKGLKIQIYKIHFLVGSYTRPKPSTLNLFRILGENATVDTFLRLLKNGWKLEIFESWRKSKVKWKFCKVWNWNKLVISWIDTSFLSSFQNSFFEIEPPWWFNPRKLYKWLRKGYESDSDQRSTHQPSKCLVQWTGPIERVPRADP